MDLGLSIAATALTAAQDGVSVYANDLANANTTAFVQETPLFTGLTASTEAADAALSPQGSSPTISFGPGVAYAGTDPAGGTGGLTETGIPTDVALQGDGYFVLGTAAGPAYTRDGSFSVDSKGDLVSASGDPVLSTQGQPINVGTSGAVVSITPAGAVLSGGKEVAVLGVATFANPGGLLPIGQNSFAASANSGPAKLGTLPQGTSLAIGALASSGTDVAASLTGLITLERSYQMDADVLSQSSQMLDWAAQMG